MRTEKKSLKDFYDPEYYNFDQICSKIESGEHFTFARYGDGEFIALMGETPNGANCDNHTYFPEMGFELAEILRRDPLYGVGIFTTEISVSPSAFAWLMANVPEYRKYSRSDVFHIEMKETSKRIERLFEAINDRGFVMVGPSHLRSMESKFNITDFVEVPKHNCWLHTDIALSEIRQIDPIGKIVCFAASMAANVWIDRLYQQYGDQCTLLDCGSIFDPFVGIPQRSFHRRAEWIKESKWY